MEVRLLSSAPFYIQRSGVSRQVPTFDRCLEERFRSVAHCWAGRGLTSALLTAGALSPAVGTPLVGVQEAVRSGVPRVSLRTFE